MSLILAATLGTFFLLLLAEWLHGRKVARVGQLAFSDLPSWTRWLTISKGVRIVGGTLLAWGLSVLLELAPESRKDTELGKTPEGGFRHIVLVVDVSPSMRLEDAGPTGQKKRILRAQEVVMEMFQRINLEQAKVSVIAMFNGAKTVVTETVDLGVIRNIMDDLPLRWAFEPGKTNLFAGLTEASNQAKTWQPESTTLFFVTDGDTIPDKGTPALPRSIRQTFVLGVGNPTQGKFIDGHQSRQDASTLRQFASRIKGKYFDVNRLNIPTRELASLSEALPLKNESAVGLREAALTAVGTGGALVGLLPLLLAGAGKIGRRVSVG